MARTASVTWAEMVQNPREGGMRILSNQIADRDEEINRLNRIIREMDQCGLSRQAAEVLHPKSDH